MKSIAVFFNSCVSTKTEEETCVRNGNERGTFIIGMTSEEQKEKGVNYCTKEYIGWAGNKIAETVIPDQYDYLVLFLCPSDIESIITAIEFIRQETPNKGLLFYLCSKGANHIIACHLIQDFCKANNVGYRIKSVEEHGEVNLRIIAEDFLVGRPLL